MKEIIITLMLCSVQINALFGVANVVYAPCIAFLYYLRYVFQFIQTGAPNLEIRLTLGQSSAIALELLPGADILKKAIEPT